MTDRREEYAPRRREAELGTSWTSVILGWLAALGASLIPNGIVGGILALIFPFIGGALGGARGASVEHRRSYA
jgi:hypothetical protein